MDLAIKGKVVANLGVQKGISKAGKDWQRATIVIETEGNYPKKIALDNMKNAEAFGNLAVGTEGTFHIEPESREFNGKWYTSINCWKWETTQQGEAQMSHPIAEQTAPPAPPADDLPF